MLLFFFGLVMVTSAMLTSTGYVYAIGHQKIAGIMVSVILTVMVIIPGVYLLWFFPSIINLF